MGAAPSGLVNRKEFCQDLEQVSKACMKLHNYNREVYQVECAQAFLDYQKCKKQWGKLRTVMQDEQSTRKKGWLGKLIDEMVDGDD